MPHAMYRVLAAATLAAGAARAAEPARLEFTGGFVIAFDLPSGAAAPQGGTPAGFSEGTWTLREIVATPAAAPTSGMSEPKVRRWLLASPPPSAGFEANDENPWDVAHAIVDRRATGRYESLSTAFGDAAPSAVEPDVYALVERAWVPEGSLAEQCLPKCSPEFGGPGSVACEPPSEHWPRGSAEAWHLGDAYSELATARRRVAAKATTSPEDRVTVFHLDTGYDPGNAANPRFLDEDRALDFTKGDEPVGGAKDPCEDGTGNFPGHGTGTLGLLAGSRIKLGPTFDDELGGAPGACVVPYRISSSVIHLRPVRMAAAIERAWSDGADVISMSMGGLPSGALRDAVNNAYMHGTALFTASGDFFKIPWSPLSTPSGVVYPARFSRVVAVAGATADLKSYAYAPEHLDRNAAHKKQWMLRGSVGPESVMRHAVTAYAPNVPWIRPSRARPGTFVDLDGAGTSAATPQAAAAAALWLQYHRDEPWLADRWRRWEKSEAVYRALLDSADKSGPKPKYNVYDFGAGLLKASRALDRVEHDVTPRAPAKIGFDWVDLVLRGSAPETALREPGAADAPVHLEMIHTELAQLAYLSRELDRLALDDDGTTPSKRKVKRFLRAVLDDPRASSYVKASIRASLR